MFEYEFALRALLVSYKPLALKTRLRYTTMSLRGQTAPSSTWTASTPSPLLPPDLPVLAERDHGPLAQVRAVDEVDVLGLLTVGVIRPEAAVDQTLLRERVDGVEYCMYSLERLLVLVPDKLDRVGFLPTAERLQAAVPDDTKFYRPRLVARVFDDLELVEVGKARVA